MADGQVVFEIKADNTKALSDIKEITKTIEQEGKNWEKDSSDSMSNVETTAKNAAEIIQGYFEGMFTKISLSAAAIKIGKMIKEWTLAAIDTASNLEEVQNVVDVTFGEEGAKQIDEWAKRAGSQFGLTELQAKKFTSTIGAMMKSSGLAGDEIVSMSEDLAGLAADMASFYNLDFEEAFSKIRAGIAGETEPLRTLGIDMTADRMNQYLKSTGSDSKYTDLDSAEKTLVRYKALMEQASLAQGDFARTSADSYANINRQIETQGEKLKETVGSELLPVAKEIKQDFLDFFKLINGDTGVVITGSKDALQKQLDAEAQSAKTARAELDKLADSYASIVGMERDDFEPGIYNSYGEFILATMRSRQMVTGGKEREQIDSALPQLEEAFSKVTEAEGKIADLQKQLDAIAENAPDTAATGAEVASKLSQGIDSKLGEVSNAVSNVLSILDRINQFRVNLNIGTSSTGGNFPLLNGSFATGLDYVPFNGYLAELHEGEGILTAEENRIWQRFKNGGAASQNVDYSALGDVMRDNVKPGGDVFLDGRVVGAVISKQQANSYRSLQRSGWQQ